MDVRLRAGRVGDVSRWSTLLAERCLYSNAQLECLERWWAELLSKEMAKSGVVCSAASDDRMLAFGIGVFVAADWADELAAHPRPFVGADLLEAWQGKAHPVLAPREIARRNAADGLDVLVLHMVTRAYLVRKRTTSCVSPSRNCS